MESVESGWISRVTNTAAAVPRNKYGVNLRKLVFCVISANNGSHGRA